MNTSLTTPPPYGVSPARRMWTQLLLLFGLTMAGLFAAAMAGLLLGNVNTAGGLRVYTVLQNVVGFIAPALAAAMICSRVPADWLELRRAPRGRMLAAAVCTLLVSVPMMNSVVAWNEALTFPPQLEATLRAMEEQAAGVVNLMFEQGTTAALVLNVLIVGVLTGLGEELLFRGALMRILSRSTKRVTHTAVWTTAIIFSLIHFQPYGFVPRLLLGALFGYAVKWSGSLWTSVALHALNNSVVAYVTWLGVRQGEQVVERFNGLGVGQPWVLAGSVVMTVGALWWMWRERRGASERDVDRAVA